MGRELGPYELPYGTPTRWGGVTMNGGARLEGTWEAMAGVMDALRADLVCTPGLRFPAVFARDSPVPSSAEGLAEAYGYLYAGFRRATYDGVGWLHRPGRTIALAPETEERIVVVEAGGGAFVGTYVEHLGHTEAAWAARLKRVAAVANQLVKGMGSSCRYIWICGDLNSRKPAHQQTAMTILAAAGFFPDGGPIATHRSGHEVLHTKIKILFPTNNSKSETPHKAFRESKYFLCFYRGAVR